MAEEIRERDGQVTMSDDTEHELVRVCSMRYADRLLRRGGYDCLISIAGSDAKNHCKRRAKRNLLLDFDDTTPWRKRLRLMTGEQMVQIIDFAESIQPDERCLVHCRAGRSRSPAVGIVIAFVRMTPRRETDTAVSWIACKYVADRHPQADPNGWVLRLADAILGLGLQSSLYCNAAKCFGKGVKWHGHVSGTNHDTC